MGRRIPMRVMMLDSTATSISAGVQVSDFRNCVLSIVGSPSANLKVFVKGGISTGTNLDTSPDFTKTPSSTRSEASAWDFVEVVDLNDGTAIDGDTGINLSGNVIRIIEVNINSLDWLAVHATGIISGTVTVVGNFTTNV